MAQKVHVEMIDDIDGEPATQTVPFSLDGVSYEIDLSDDNASSLRDELARFVAAGQRTGGRKVRLATGQSAGTAAPSRSDRERTRQIRAWAQDNGYEVSTRGRLSTQLVDAFDEAQQAGVEIEPAVESPAKAPRKRAARKKNAS